MHGIGELRVTMAKNHRYLSFHHDSFEMD